MERKYVDLILHGQDMLSYVRIGFTGNAKHKPNKTYHKNCLT